MMGAIPCGHRPEWSDLSCGDEAVGRDHKCGCMRVNTSEVFEADTYATPLCSK